MAEERAPGATHGEQPFNKVGGGLGYIDGLPPELSRRGGAVRLGELGDELSVARLEPPEGLVGDGGLDAVEP